MAQTSTFSGELADPRTKGLRVLPGCFASLRIRFETGSIELRAIHTKQSKGTSLTLQSWPDRGDKASTRAGCSTPVYQNHGVTHSKGMIAPSSRCFDDAYRQAQGLHRAKPACSQLIKAVTSICRVERCMIDCRFCCHAVHCSSVYSDNSLHAFDANLKIS